jgi:hypothetical protein
MAACPRDCVLSGLRLKADTQSGVDGGNTVYIFVYSRKKAPVRDDERQVERHAPKLCDLQFVLLKAI